MKINSQLNAAICILREREKDQRRNQTQVYTVELVPCIKKTPLRQMQKFSLMCQPNETLRHPKPPPKNHPKITYKHTHNGWTNRKESLDLWEFELV